jgi:hypothetical protein
MIWEPRSFLRYISSLETNEKIERNSELLVSQSTRLSVELRGEIYPQPCETRS